VPIAEDMTIGPNQVVSYLGSGHADAVARWEVNWSQTEASFVARQENSNFTWAKHL